MTSPCSPEITGANPAIVQWSVIRGDTSELRFDFYENDEITLFDTSGWTYLASAYDFKGEVVDELTVVAGDGYVNVIATPEITALWGTGYGKVVAELAFDLQVTIDGTTVWTPVIGTISVLGDVTGGSL
tara:strand:+ start:4561 stop:4947 length:387 start_codon:yes stop_codon:yes gene_type:complete